MAFDPTVTLDTMTRQGKTFAASTDSFGWTNLGRMRIALVNPANSGKVVRLTCIVSGNASGVMGTIKVWHNPTAGIPTTLAPIPAKNCCLAASSDTTSAPAAKAIVYSDANQYATAALLGAGVPAMSGGTQMPTLLLPPQTRQVFGPSPVVIMPGVTLGFDILVGAVTVTGNTVASLYWVEDNL